MTHELVRPNVLVVLRRGEYTIPEDEKERRAQAVGMSITMLKSMPSAKEWDKGRVDAHGIEIGGDADIYALYLRDIDAELMLDTMRYIMLHRKWRPSIAEIVEVAASIAAPVPDVETVCAEISYKVVTIGVQRPRNEEAYSLGYENVYHLHGCVTPKLSHPVVAQIVSMVGGWEDICIAQSEHWPSVRKAIHDAYETAARDWQEGARTLLTLPKEEREKRLPEYKPFVLQRGVDWAIDATPRKALEAANASRRQAKRLQAQTKSANPMPERVRSMIGSLVKQKTMPQASEEKGRQSQINDEPKKI